jgi:hypothetical protein
MKKLLVILLLLVSGLSFSQEKKKTLDERINRELDSLSKVYKKKVVGYGYTSYRGVKKTKIIYIENGKEITKIIKTEIVGTPIKENE